PGGQPGGQPGQADGQPGSATPPGPGLPADEPKATGKPLQLDKVEIPAVGPLSPGAAPGKRTYIVTWEVTGDEGEVDHYEVFLDLLNIEEAGSGGPVLKSAKLGDAMPGSRSL